MELNYKFHGKAPNEEEYTKASDEIEKIVVKTVKQRLIKNKIIPKGGKR